MRLDLHDPVRITNLVGRTEEQPVDDSEHRGIGADAEPDGEDDRGGESRLRAQSAQCVSHVMPEAIDHWTFGWDGVSDSAYPQCVEAESKAPAQPPQLLFGRASADSISFSAGLRQL